jgi:YrbI family 3-deoxy-D-manno-octulosonate 8-phosphate phosphatase
MTTVAIVPARGGSKGIPGKNLQVIGSRSLLVRTVEAASGADHVDEVVVSTDDAAIAVAAIAAGAKVVERPPELAEDTSTSESALLHAAGHLNLADDDVIVFLQCTSPFTSGADIDQLVDPVVEGRADATFTAVPFHGFVWRVEDGGAVGANHDAATRPRRQDRPAQWLETGAGYAFRLGPFRAAGHRFHGRTLPVQVTRAGSIEIDEPGDLATARMLAPLVDPLPRLPRPGLLVLDFDGVFTDNRVLVDETGREAVWAHRGDGHGLARLARELPIVVLSTEVNPVVTRRCEKLGLAVEQGLGEEKQEALERLAERRGVPLSDVMFVGNDVNDLGCMRIVGVAVAVADAAPEVLAVADHVLHRTGGNGALRELSDILLQAREDMDP